MLVEMCRAKLHRATVTGVEPDYEGSLTVDGDLLDAVGILDYEKILVGNLRNGSRFETYAIRGKKGSGDIVLNGATAHHGKVGDRIIVFAFAHMDLAEAKKFRPSIIVLGEGNQVTKKLP
jgi:aspartate 1-decarboxylase